MVSFWLFMTTREEPIPQGVATPLNKPFLTNCLNAYDLINNANKIDAGPCPLGVFGVTQAANIAGDQEQRSLT